MVLFKNYFFLCVLIFLSWSSTGVNGFTPAGRFGQSSALVGKRLYFFGSAVNIQARETIFLDVTLSKLNFSTPLWSLSNASVLTDSAFASACVGGPNKNTIFLLEHQDTNNTDTNTTVVYSFDTVSSTWAIRAMSGNFPVSRQQFQAVNDNDGKIYMFGGINTLGVAFNDIFILDTLSVVWIQGSSIGAPTARFDFSATLLKNGFILYIGGDDNIDMAKIPIFNTINGTWFTMVAVGDIISSRGSHTAVLSPDGHVIIYGGVKNNSALDQSQQLASLDTTVNPYKWSKKSLNGINIPPPLSYHSAAIVGNFMILAFGLYGVYNDVLGPNSNSNTQIYLLDTRNYMWVTDTLQHTNSANSSIPQTPQTPSVTQIQTVIVSNSSNTGVIVEILIIGLIVILVIISLAGYWLYKRNQQNDVVRVAGSK